MVLGEKETADKMLGGFFFLTSMKKDLGWKRISICHEVRCFSLLTRKFLLKFLINTVKTNAN